MIPEFPRLVDYLVWWAERTPDAEALVLGETRLTYRALQDQVVAAARALRAFGVRPGDRVAALQTPRPEYLVTLLAANSIGAIWVGLNPRYKVEELRHVIADSQPRLLFTRSRIGERIYEDDLCLLATSVSGAFDIVVFDGDPPLPGSATFEAFLERGNAAEQAVDGRDLPEPAAAAIIVYTSGSTGKPKGAVLSHRGIAQFALNQNRLWPMSPYRALNYFPINHVGCVCDVTAPALVAGGTIVFMEQFGPEGSLELMERERITLWGSVPTVFQLQLAVPDFARFDLSAVQLIVWEGAPMGRETINRLATLGPPMATNYGMTETTSAITAVVPTRNVELLAGSVGPAFPGVEVRLVDERGVAVSAGQEGEIQARSAQQLLTYWNNPEATEKSLTPDGFFRTGDLAVQRPDGGLAIVGRLKEMYKSGGYNVYPREVEAVLESHPAVAVAAVVGVSDPLWGESGVAFVELAGQIDEQDLLAWCRTQLANYKTPKRIEILANLPLLPIGKIDKPKLIDLAKSRLKEASAV